MISAVVPTHSKGFAPSMPTRCRMIAMDSVLAYKSPPKIVSTLSADMKGYMVMKTERHFGHRPHHELRLWLRLQLLNVGNSSGKAENARAIWISYSGRTKLK